MLCTKIVFNAETKDNFCIQHVLNLYFSGDFNEQSLVILCRGVSGGWAGWAIAQSDFGRIEATAGQQQWRAALLLAHPVLGSYLRP